MSNETQPVAKFPDRIGRLRPAVYAKAELSQKPKSVWARERFRRLAAERRMQTMGATA